MAVNAVRPMTPDDMEHVIANLRAADRTEIVRLMGPVEPRTMIELTCGRAEAALTGLHDGEIACIFGINRRSYLSDVGVPWMLSTDAIYRVSWPFYRLSREYVGRMQRAFPQMANVVDVDNLLAVEWLRWLGFAMDEPKPMGVAETPFIHFSMGMR